MILIGWCIFGFFSVAFGAYSEHGLRPKVSDEEFRMLMTAIRYNQINSLMISVLGLIYSFKEWVLKYLSLQTKWTFIYRGHHSFQL